MTFDSTIAPYDQSATLKRQIATYTGPASYATGGDAVDAGVIRGGRLLAIGAAVATDGTTAYLLWLDVANQKILWFVASTGLEVAALVDLSAFTVTTEFVGN